VQVSYGQVAFFTDAVPPWVGFGLRGGWGKNFGLHRLGGALAFVAEGDIGIHTLLGLEPSVEWNFVSNGGLLLGAGVGPSFMYTVSNVTVESESAFYVVPTASVRIVACPLVRTTQADAVRAPRLATAASPRSAGTRISGMDFPQFMECFDDPPPERIHDDS
jgi:hypothetical protein